MKKLISLILCCLICGITSAQLIKQKVEKQKKQSELDWYNCSFDRDSVYGAEVNKAYEYLNANKKKLKKRPIVALIGTGMDECFCRKFFQKFILYHMEVYISRILHKVGGILIVILNCLIFFTFFAHLKVS